jgi:fumarate hydratase, class II
MVQRLMSLFGPATASKIAHYAMENDLTLKTAALRLVFVSEAEFDRAVDPKKMVKPFIAAASA